VLGQYRRELDAGPSLAVSLGAPLTAGLRVRTAASFTAVDILGSGSVNTYTLGLDVPVATLREARRFPVQLRAGVDAGAAQLRYGDVRSWHPTVAGGLRLTGGLTDRLSVFGDAAAAVTPLGDRKAILDVATDRGGTLVQLPLRAGLRWQF
jgi:hypothetical protein